MGHFRWSYRFYYDFGVSGMHGSIRLVKRSPNDRIRPKVDSRKPQILTWRLSKRFFLGFENMGDMGWAGNALFGPWGGVTWAQLRYAGDGDSQFAWGGHEKAEKCDRVWKRIFFGSFERLGEVLITFLTLLKKWLPANWSQSAIFSYGPPHI